MMDLETSVKKYIKRHDLLAKGDRILVAVSGGPDSVALLHILHALRYELGIHLHVVHINHNLRKESRLEQKSVETLAERLSIPHSISLWRNPRPRDKSLEARARAYRLRVYEKLSKSLKISKVALGHTENDTAETVLMHVLRGTGLQGMQGILPMKTIGRVNIIRPLLKTTKNAVLLYLKNKKISYRQDPSNTNAYFYRNKIRTQLLPLLVREYSPAIVSSLSNMAETITSDYEYIESTAATTLNEIKKKAAAKKQFCVDTKSLRDQHVAIRRVLIRLGIERIQGNKNRITAKHVDNINALLSAKRPQARIDLPSGICVKINSDTISFCRE